MAGSKESTTFLGVDREKARKWGFGLTGLGILVSWVTPIGVLMAVVGVATLAGTAGKKK